MSKRTFTDACVLGVEVTTNTPRGGDSGHGGRTVVRLINEGGVDMYDSTVVGVDLDVGEVVLAFGGDAEARVLADALIWAGRKLRHQIEDNAADADPVDDGRACFVCGGEEGSMVPAYTGRRPSGGMFTWFAHEACSERFNAELPTS